MLHRVREDAALSPRQLRFERSRITGSLMLSVPNQGFSFTGGQTNLLTGSQNLAPRIVRRPI